MGNCKLKIGRYGAVTELILASGSPRRQELLHALGVPFRTVLSGYHERSVRGRAAGTTVMAHARGKAAAVARTVQRGIVVGADTLVWRNGVAYGKPRDLADARRMLRALEGKTHEVHTGLAVCDVARKRWRVASVCTKVTMRPLDAAEIEWYLKKVNPLDKAGAYAIQEAGGIIIKCTSGCYYNVIGFPVATLEAMLRALGYSLTRNT